MQISPFHIYLWQVADTAQGMLTPVVVVAVFCSLILLGMYVALSDSPDERALYTKLGPSIWKATSFFFILRLLTPSSDAIAMMIVIPKLVNSEVVQKDIPELYTIALNALKSELAKK